MGEAERLVLPAVAQAEPARPAVALASRRRSPGPPIEAKLHRPTARREWVPRPELVGYLAGVTAKLLLVDAPAGFGKTTVVAQWRLSPAESRPFAWVSLDSGDNDPGRLWWHVVSALDRACPEFDADNILGALQVQAHDFARTFLPLLVNELAALPEPVVLVLDDCHMIKEGRCYDQLAFLLLHLPSAVQLVLITRVDPPLPLARLRGTGDMVEIRAGELQFGSVQAAELVARAAGVELSEPDLAELVDRTEGWPAGLYLAALSLRAHPSPGGFIRQFTGDSRFVLDFLTEEVLSRQPAEIRQFLARTAVLGRFCAPLCDAVTGSGSSSKIINILERENLFVVPLDDSRQWFRYHHLFAQALRRELDRTEPDIVPVLHERASGWHRHSGSADEAISHARAAGDVTGAIDLIAGNWCACVDSGQAATVQGWLAALGDSTISAHPLAAHCAAWVAALAGDRDSLRRWLPIVEAAHRDDVLPDGIRSLRSSAALLQGTFGFEGLGPMREAAARAVTLETDPASSWHALARSSYAATLYWSGELDAATEQARAALSGMGSIALIRMVGRTVLSLIAIDQGNLDEAEQQARTARDIVTAADSGLSGAPQSSLAFAAAGAVSAGRGRLTEAREELERALQMRRRHPGISSWPTLEVLLRLAPVLLETGERSRAMTLIAEARLLLASSPDGAGTQLGRLGQVERRLAGEPQGMPVIDPLTDREVTVLRLLGGSMSMREIAQELCVSPNTVKTHTRAIYRKLGVSTRHDAINTLQITPGG
jgi:LuxR family transcriptional regulator, maltose regulon positive regulatory protein